jgi:hypothetical protein
MVCLALNPVRDMKIKDMDFVELYQRQAYLQKQISESPCHTCPHFKEQVNTLSPPLSALFA